jgi:chaperonin cofactor prefoldin
MRDDKDIEDKIREYRRVQLEIKEMLDDLQHMLVDLYRNNAKTIDELRESVDGLRGRIETLEHITSDKSSVSTGTI